MTPCFAGVVVGLNAVVSGDGRRPGGARVKVVVPGGSFLSSNVWDASFLSLLGSLRGVRGVCEWEVEYSSGEGGLKLRTWKTLSV